MRDHHRTRLITSEHSQSFNRGQSFDRQQNRHQLSRHQGQRTTQRPTATHPADATLTSDLTNQKFVVQQREHAQLLAENRRINPPHGIGGDIPGGFGLNYRPNTRQPSGPPDPNRREKHYRLNNNYCWTHGYDIGDSHTSATCNNRKPGHIATARGCNNQGGNLLHKDKSQWPNNIVSFVLYPFSSCCYCCCCSISSSSS